ncbi:hypothetical protein [Streptomyces sp. JJ38]|uniref:hypothetical protein n=1 Tax=Streptomyces sp. JJ38 TaxID=2738128 RepID=UPI001C59E765|nr:hypothetical protein [Streptomyces sp. JJ38]MBW1598026.1 hypothetical protein [Streptomyces sp. JJ38]
MSTTVKNAVHGDISVGTVLSWTKRYTDQEVHDFFELSGNAADPLPEELPYLLVVAPLTKLGGDLDYLSQKMDWSVARPVGRDEEITAELEVTRLEPTEGMTKIAFNARIRCGDDVVITGRSKGFIVGV